MNDPICPTCNIPVGVRTSKRVGTSQFRYHKCGHRAVVSRDEIKTRAPGQRKRLLTTEMGFKSP